MGPICNEKVAEKWNLWVREQCTNALFTMESKHLRLLCINSSRITPKRVKKKRKKEKRTKHEDYKRKCSKSPIQMGTLCS